MQNTLNRNYTEVVKFISCIMIYILHFYCNTCFRYVEPLGLIGCVVFFFLSSYGVTLSQKKNKLGFVNYTLYRLKKIWIPLIIVNIAWLLFVFINNSTNYFPLINIKDFSIGAAFLYVLDINKMDAVTWFLHILLLSYLFIWILLLIRNRRWRIIVAILTYILSEALQFYFVCPNYIKIDTIGILLGFIYAEYQAEINSIIYKNFHVLSFTTFFMFVGGLLLLYFYLENFDFQTFIIFIILGIFYTSMFVFFIMILGKCNSLLLLMDGRYKICSYLGSLSFYVYLIHNKIIMIMDHNYFVLCLLIIILLSISFDKLHSFIKI